MLDLFHLCLFIDVVSSLPLNLQDAGHKYLPGDFFSPGQLAALSLENTWFKELESVRGRGDRKAGLIQEMLLDTIHMCSEPASQQPCYETGVIPTHVEDKEPEAQITQLEEAGQERKNLQRKQQADIGENRERRTTNAEEEEGLWAGVANSVNHYEKVHEDRG
ncbi:hypothetical protein P7K49_014829 [Saguinus oedipus]|uniref:Uncharacterized protein n=1 Tax=Saguinus oedipus TaxID=9490 RepID=A0ABQ9V8C3_SAGOE|nr:hypothetical protein P7K49_014829 [Saguinus oedipus]